MPEKPSSLLECFWLGLATKWVVWHSPDQASVDVGQISERQCVEYGRNQPVADL